MELHWKQHFGDGETRIPEFPFERHPNLDIGAISRCAEGDKFKSEV